MEGFALSPQSNDPLGKLDFEKLVSDARAELRNAVKDAAMQKPSLREPSADARALGGQMMNFYAGFVGSGFTDQQAMGLVGQILSATILSNARKSE